MIPNSREARIGEVLIYALEDLEVAGRWLVADDRGGVGEALRDRCEVVTWYRTAQGGQSAAPLPPSGPFDGVVLRLPRGSEAMRMVWHLVASQLSEDGVLVLGGGNDEGIRPTAKRLRDLFDDVEVVATRRHCRVVVGRRPTPDLRGALTDWQASVEAEVAGVDLRWVSWPTLFAHGRLDVGTRQLLEALPPLEGRVLDFACGAGVIGQFLRARGDACTVDQSDVSALATHAAEINNPGAQTWTADGMPTEGGPWNHIVSNPPIHLGNDSDHSIVQALAATTPHRLARGGHLWLVVQGTVPVKRTLADAFAAVDCVSRTPAFSVWRARRKRLL
ncbi:MAG: methyltransferase [Myxococcales bacterium]|nr:methyltransferase [Myxococcales bacterium]